jgi:SAM-dependent methyltransferase
MAKEIKNSLVKSYDTNARLRDKGDLDSWKIEERINFYALLKKERKASLLEIGAGNGRDGHYFKQNDLQVICIDLSPEMVETCKEKGLEARVMDFYHLDFPDQSFDAVWSMNCLLHVPKNDLPVVLSEIKRVLKPKGLFYVGVYGGYDFEGIWDEDTYTPKRFFSFFTHDGIIQAVGKYFEIAYYKTIALENRRTDFQSIILRKS